MLPPREQHVGSILWRCPTSWLKPTLPCLASPSTTYGLLKLNEIGVAKGWQTGEKSLAGRNTGITEAQPTVPRWRRWTRAKVTRAPPAWRESDSSSFQGPGQRVGGPRT